MRKDKLYPDQSALSLSAGTLTEIRKLSEDCPFDLTSLNYHDYQAMLLIYGLKEWIESFGIQCPYDITQMELLNRGRQKSDTRS